MTKLATSAVSPNTHLMVPVFIFSILLSIAALRGPLLISSSGIGSAVIVVAPLILATYALTIIVMAGRAGVDLSIGPLIGFLNVGLIQLLSAGVIESPIAFFLYALAVGVAYQLLMGLIIVFVRVQPIIVSLSGYLALVGLNLLILPRPGGVAPDWMLTWGGGTEIWSPILIILIIATAAWYAIARTAFFGHLRLMGSDERAAYTSGVKVNLVRLGAHCIGGLYAGLAAICFTALISSGDPTQGTTLTLLAVTALVLGGANLAGGRGGAIGSMFGALNIYLITYILGTFNFGRFQSFVTDLSYGTILVLSLLISLALPQIQKVARYLSPLLFVAILSSVAGGVILHAVMDISTIQEVAGADTPAFVEEIPAAEGEAAAVPSIAGTVIMLVILGIAAAIYLVSVLVRYPRAPMVVLFVLIIATGLGLIFRDAGVAANTAAVASRGIGNSLDYLALESTDFRVGEYSYPGAIVMAAYGVILVLGIVLLATLIIRLNLSRSWAAAPGAPAVLGGLALGAIAVLSVVSVKLGGMEGLFGGESLFILLGAMMLFVFTYSPLQTMIPNVSNVYLAALSVLALGFVYFWAPPQAGPGMAPAASAAYAPSIFANRAPEVNANVSYARPGRMAADAAASSVTSKWAYSLFIIVLLQYLVWRCMRRDYRLAQFWPYLHIVVGAALAWGAMFYSIGMPLLHIAVVIAAAALTAPFVWRLFAYYIRGRFAEGARQ